MCVCRLRFRSLIGDTRLVVGGARLLFDSFNMPLVFDVAGRRRPVPPAAGGRQIDEDKVRA